jgi:peptide/nickel transport system substrate-binding protein
VTRPRLQRARTGAAAALLIALAATITACTSSSLPASQSGAASGGVSKTTLNVGLLGDIGQPPDPDIYYANSGQALIQSAYEGLVQYASGTAKPGIEPLLATSWTISPDKRVYTFYLRQGVKFHDGTLFTSEAVKVSFARRAALKGGAAYMVAGVKSVNASNPKVAIVTLTQPNSAFLDYLASPFGPKMESPTALKEHAGTDDAQTYLQTHDIGTGPYTYASMQAGTGYTLKAFPGYWGTKPQFTTVNLTIYTDGSTLQLATTSGQVDLTWQLPTSSYEQIKANTSLVSYSLPSFSAALIDLNPTRSFFSSRQARVAFLESIDQSSLVKEAFDPLTTPATTLYGQGMITDGSDRQDIRYDPSALADYVKTLPSGTPVVVGFATNNSSAQEAANIEAAQLDGLGLKATAQGYTNAQVYAWLQDPQSGPDVFIDGSNGPDGANPYMWGEPFWGKDGGINYFGCDVPETDQYLAMGLATGSTADYDRAAQAYSANGCYMNLAHHNVWVVTDKRVGGLRQADSIATPRIPRFNELTIAS